MVFKEYNTVSIHESKWPTKEEFSKYKKSKFQKFSRNCNKSNKICKAIKKTSEGIGLENQFKNENFY